MDAFSSDAIPLHLLTTEAIALYRKHLAPHGIIAFHISNQYLNLAPEIAQLAIATHMQSRLIETPGNDSDGYYRATWVLLTDGSTFFERPEIAAAAEQVPTIPGLRPWTDDYSNILGAVWRRLRNGEE